MEAPSATDLQEENRMLASELNRVEEMLSASRAERDELGIKYNALSERVSRVCIYGIDQRNKVKVPLL